MVLRAPKVQISSELAILACIMNRTGFSAVSTLPQYPLDSAATSQWQFTTELGLGPASVEIRVIW